MPAYTGIFLRSVFLFLPQCSILKPFSQKNLGQFLALSEKTLPLTFREKLHVYIFSNKNWSNI